MIDASPEPMATKTAQDGRVSVAQASRALKRLHEIGARQRLGRGRYRVNPHLAFRGALEDREAAATHVVPLKPHEPA
jgi:predicted transcriptional regulator of viral defense system